MVWLPMVMLATVVLQMWGLVGHCHRLSFLLFGGPLLCSRWGLITHEHGLWWVPCIRVCEGTSLCCVSGVPIGKCIIGMCSCHHLRSCVWRGLRRIWCHYLRSGCGIRYGWYSCCCLSLKRKKQDSGLSNDMKVLWLIFISWDDGLDA